MVCSNLLLPKHHIQSLVILCADFGHFEFAREDYHQIGSLTMGTPLSALLPCLFMEMLEIAIMHFTWLCYIQISLSLSPEDHAYIKHCCSSIPENIQFTVEEEDHHYLSHWDDDGRGSSVYRKPTNKDDYIHY